MSFYSYTGDGYGPGVNDVDIQWVHVCETPGCGFDDVVDARSDHGLVFGLCPWCGSEFESPCD